MVSLPDPNPAPTITAWDLVQTGITVCFRLPWTIFATLARRWSPWSSYRPPPLKEHLFRHVMTCLGNHVPQSIWNRSFGDPTGASLLTSTRYSHLNKQIFQLVRRRDFSGYWFCRGLSIDPIEPRRADLVILHAHGGGYALGHPSASAPEHILLAEILQRHRITTAIFSIDYTLSPTGKFPKQRDEILAAYDWLRGDMGIDSGRIVVMGDSAGGHLILTLLVGLHERELASNLQLGEKMDKPAAAVLVSPWVNLYTSHPRFLEMHWEERLFKLSLDTWCSTLFQGTPEKIVNVYGNFALAQAERGSWVDILPRRTWVSAGSEELAFRYDIEDFVDVAKQDSASIVLEVEEGKDHSWQCAEAFSQHARLLDTTMEVDDGTVHDRDRASPSAPETDLALGKPVDIGRLQTKSHTEAKRQTNHQIGAEPTPVHGATAMRHDRQKTVHSRRIGEPSIRADAHIAELGGVRVRIERIDELLVKELAQRFTRDALDELPDEVALRLQVVARLRARGPPGLLLDEFLRRVRKIEQLGDLQRGVPRGQTGAVAEKMADLDLVTAVAAELGPVFGDRGIEIQLSAVGQEKYCQCHPGLGRRPDRHDGIFLPWLRLRGVGIPAPEVDDGLVADGHAERGADFVAGLHVLLEDIADGGERGITVSVDFSHDEFVCADLTLGSRPGSLMLELLPR
ncbi:Alpha/Beta hydrolase protein [Aspergillus floccosus]